MQYRKSIFLFVLMSSMLAFSPNVTSYATDPDITIYGTMNSFVCKGLGGVLEANAIDAAHTHIVQLCKYDDRYFWIEIPQGGCIESIGTWNDPETGTHSVPTPCDVPRPCAKSKTWPFWPGSYRSAIQVKAEGEQFDIVMRSQAIMCDFKFSQDEKKISIVAKGMRGTNASLDIAIPTELLSGQFEVSVDEENIGFMLTSFSPVTIDPQDKRKVKFDPSGFYEKILGMINAGEKREYLVLLYTSDKDALVNALIDVHKARDVHKAEVLSFVIARVPVEELPKLADYSYVGIINDSEDQLVGVGNLSSSTISFGFDFDSEEASASSIAERKIDITGTQVIPEFPHAVLVIFSSVAFLAVISRLMPKLSHSNNLTNK